MPNRSRIARRWPIVLLALACDRAAAPRPAAHAPDRAARRFASPPRDTLWRRVVETADSMPTAALLSADTASVYVADIGARAVVALDGRTGSLRWRARGDDAASPLREPRAMTAHRAGGVVVYDNGRGAMVTLGPDGTVLRVTPAARAADAQSICELPDASTLVSVAGSSRGVMRIATTGRVLSVTPLPWPELRAAGDLLGAVALAPTRDGCLAALSFGRGFAEFADSAFRAPLPYVEPLELPRVVVTRTVHDGSVTVSQSLAEHVLGAIDVATTRDGRLVAFDGRTADRAHLVDLYDTLGTYRRTIRTGTRVEALAASDSALYVLTHLQGMTTVVALRWPRGHSSDPLHP